MLLTYDPEHNIAYIRLREPTTEVQTITISDQVNIDLSPDGTRYGIELINANEQLRNGDEKALIQVLNQVSGHTAELSL